ncbi:hypothetical protein [Fibrella forsythiae]|uniref:Uncharacterized protein n=1 Tax=Fibrella forsythiae TaxID=2817061 RepID=A0ABS3JAC1_9BACT|nr:hypothetical protein [Fibrella forsythiae]MBO0946944.1 hypothetical protein [Fibrella forsythiae]
MKSLLTWQEALDIMRRLDGNGLPVPFSMTAITANQTRQTGGESITFARAILCRRGDQDNAATSPQAPARSVSDGPRKPNWMYRIRNLDSNQIRQVHLHLILYINEHPVR